MQDKIRLKYKVIDCIDFFKFSQKSYKKLPKIIVIQHGGNNWKGYYEHVTRKHDESRIEQGNLSRKGLGQLKDEILTWQ